MITNNEPPQDEDTVSMQEARAKLRECFLRGINELYEKECSILTYEKSTLQATFAGWSTEGNEILVHNLKTPSREAMDSALLRTPDILAIKFNGPLELP